MDDTRNAGNGGGRNQEPQPEADKKVPRPAAVPRKIIEPPGNLRKREDWFRRRSGG